MLKVRDLATGADLPDVIENWRYGLVWAADSKSFLYTDADENWRSKTVWHHRLGDPQSADRVVYREAGRRNSASRSAARSRGPLHSSPPAISSTNEVRLLPTGDFTAEPVLVSPRKKNRRYDVDERDGTLYIRVNDTHVNFRIVTAPVASPGDMDRADRGSRPPLHPRPHELREPAGDRGAHRRPVADPAARL